MQIFYLNDLYMYIKGRKTPPYPSCIDHSTYSLFHMLIIYNDWFSDYASN